MRKKSEQLIPQSEINGGRPIAPVIESGDLNPVVCTGLTKREYFAGLVLQGMLSRDAMGTLRGDASDAVRYADALLQELAGEWDYSNK